MRSVRRPGVVGSPLHIVGALAGLSVLFAVPARHVGRLSVGLSRIRAFVDAAGSLPGDVLLPVAVVVVSTIDRIGIGVVFSWLLIAYVVYRFADSMFPGRFGSIFEPRGVRASIAMLSLWGGLLLEWGVGANRTVILVSTICWLFVAFVWFGAYFRYVHPVRLLEPGSDTYLFLDATITGRELSAEIADAQRLGGWWETRLDVQLRVTFLSFLVIPCLFIGLVGMLVHLVYPIVEGVVLIGVVAIALDRRLGASRRLPDRSAFALDLQLIDTLSGATQNMKGMMMFLLALVGALLSGMLVSGMIVGVALYLPAELLPQALSAVALAFDVSIVVGVRLFVYFGLLVAFALSGMVVTGYTMYFWIQQLRRVEAYARWWERRRSGADATDIVPSTARPSGLLAPLAGWCVIVALFGVLLDTNASLVVLSIAMAGAGVVGVIAAVAVRRSLRDARPQPLEHESRNLLIAWLFMVAGLLVLLRTFAGVPARHLVMAVLFVIGLVVVSYLPDIADRKHTWTSSSAYLRSSAVFYGSMGLLMAIGMTMIALSRFSPRVKAALLSLCVIILLWMQIVWVLEYVKHTRLGRIG